MRNIQKQITILVVVVVELIVIFSELTHCWRDKGVTWHTGGSKISRECVAGSTAADAAAG